MSISWTASWSGSVPRPRVAAALVALLAIPAVAAGQDPNLVDQGRYDITIGNRVAGTETFAIRRQGEGYMAVGRIQVEGEGTWLRSAEFGLRTDGAYAPVRFETRALGPPAHTVIVTRNGTRLRITTSSDEGDRMTELLATPDQVLLGPGIAQHYYFAIRRIEASGGSPANLVAILPGGDLEQPVHVHSVAAAELKIGGSTQPANRYDLDVGRIRHVVWVDPADGRILMVEIPDRQWTSVRRPGN
ncbi:MAG: hypothetical protein OEM23_06665 [Gemmatimonadota bacterium]|nr:hypothetical protein [Gemmatimonadota bacterium]